MNQHSFAIKKAAHENKRALDTYVSADQKSTTTLNGHQSMDVVAGHLVLVKVNFNHKTVDISSVNGSMDGDILIWDKRRLARITIRLESKSAKVIVTPL